MDLILQPWHLFLTIFGLWLNEQLQHRIDFLNDQVEELMKLNGKKRILLTDVDASEKTWRSTGGL